MPSAISAKEFVTAITNKNRKLRETASTPKPERIPNRELKVLPPNEEQPDYEVNQEQLGSL